MLTRIIDEINEALEHELFIAALSLALTLPDICGKAKYPSECTSKRYIDWCREYVSVMERSDSPYSADMPYLSEEVIYQLRNSLLHQGTPNIKVSKIREERCKTDNFALLITDEGSLDSGTTKVAYGEKMKIVEREQIVSIRHLCYILCKAANSYYSEHTEQFNFFDYRIIDKRKGE